MLVAQACAFNGVPICTVYDTLAPESIIEHLQQSDAHALFTTAEILETIVNALSRLPKLKVVVYDGTPAQSVMNHFKKHQNFGREITIMHLDAVRGVGINTPHSPRRVKPSDIFCCMFTSGGSEYSYLHTRPLHDDRKTTTRDDANGLAGMPKGVLLSHGNIVAAGKFRPLAPFLPCPSCNYIPLTPKLVAAAALLVDDVLAKQELFLAFLPQAHIFEFIVEMLFLTAGIQIAYGRVKTLTDAGVLDCKSDIMEAQPVSTKRHCHFFSDAKAIDH
jgi:long-chain acyl-CoA synthetase